MSCYIERRDLDIVRRFRFCFGFPRLFLPGDVTNVEAHVAHRRDGKGKIIYTWYQVSNKYCCMTLTFITSINKPKRSTPKNDSCTFFAQDQPNNK